MNDDFLDPAFLAQVNAEFDALPVTKKTNPEYARERFQCEACGGTGRWAGGTNSHGNSKCNVCHGQGFLVTSPEARAKSKLAARASKARKAGAAREANAGHGNGYLIKWLENIREWNTFAASLLEQHQDGWEWSDKQVEACRRMYTKMKSNQEAKAVAKAAAPEVDLTPIRAMFDAVVAKGFKRPKYRAEGFVISLAPAHGANAGALYVKSVDDVYMGKLVGNRFHGVRESQGSRVGEALQAIAADPLGAAVRYGNATGSCACCGRELTKHESIERGVGPICAERWGLLDAKWGMDPKAAKKELDAELG